WGDNQPSYTVHNGTALLVSGSLLGGDDATHAALNCASGCAETPAPGNTTGRASVCTGVPFNLSIQNPSSETGISYQWESSADGSTWANAPGTSTNATYSATQTAATW